MKLSKGEEMRILITFLLLTTLVYGQNAWINEFHYDNEGSSDVGEFIEVAIEDYSNYDLAKFRISFYTENGSRYGVYHYLDEFSVGLTQNNITFFSKYIEGIQNGPSDGIALTYDGSVLLFISYEGNLTALEGDASGLTSTDIGKSESSSTPVGSSLGLTGTGTNYDSFTWTIFSTASPGQPNGNQVLPVELTSFSAKTANQKVSLEWKTATEVNNYGFNIERKQETNDWSKVGFVEGHGNSNSPKFYSFVDKSLTIPGKYLYRLKQIDIDGKYKYSDEVEIQYDVATKFELLQNYPNPFNPTTSIKYSVPKISDANFLSVQLIVYDVLGRKVETLVNERKSPGNYEIKFNAGKLNSGIYYYELKTGDFHKIKKMILLK